MFQLNNIQIPESFLRQDPVFLKYFKGKIIPYALSFIPDHLEDVCCKVSTQSLIEAELATHQHRWPEMRKIQKQFYDNVADKVISAEVDILKVFNLPSFDEVTDSLLNDDPDPDLPPFTVNDSQLKAFKRIVEELNTEITGNEKLEGKGIKLSTQMPLLHYFMFSSYSSAINKIIKDIISHAPEGFDPRTIEATQLVPQLENYYLQAAIRDGGNRITSELAIANFEAVKKEIIAIAKEGKSPWAAARFLHKNYGGKLWYWKRITRSEPVLAANAGYRAQSEASGTHYEKWSAAANACDICATLDGHQWKVNEGPEPVSSTHPHCCCIKYSLYLPDKDKPINDPWTNDPYTSEGRENLPVVLSQLL